MYGVFVWARRAIKVPKRRFPARAEEHLHHLRRRHQPAGDATAFQIEGAFGANTGGVNPLFFNALSTAKYDSWLSVGLTEGDDQNDIGSIGIDFGTWTATAPLSTK